MSYNPAGLLLAKREIKKMHAGGMENGYTHFRLASAIIFIKVLTDQLCTPSRIFPRGFKLAYG